MIYSIKDGKYSGDNTLSTAWGAAFIAGAAERGYECAGRLSRVSADGSKRCICLPHAVKSALQTIGNSITRGVQAGSALTATGAL